MSHELQRNVQDAPPGRLFCTSTLLQNRRLYLDAHLSIFCRLRGFQGDL
jgi:hypothetical protein